MSFIPQSFIDELLARVDIVDVINARVPLRKTGRNYMACCPFHNEKTASFSVVPDKQFYHCFGCQAAGSAIKFVMTFDNIEFIDAVEKLASEHGLEVPREQSSNTTDNSNSNRYQLFYNVLQKTAEFYQKNLHANKIAQDYLNNRGIDFDLAKLFLVGFAMDGWDNLTKAISTNLDHHLLQNAGYTLEQLLEQAGLKIRKTEEDSNTHSNIYSNKSYDRFRNRLMFPIRDIKGRVVAFGGRVLDETKPKYLNSPETLLFHKSSELYGLYESLRQSTVNKTKINRFVIVEGYIDVIALFQYGIDYAVATLGTATSYRHLAKLFKYSQEVIYCFDGDLAGQNAAWRALENSLSALYDGRVIKFLFLPQGHDPDTYIRQFGKHKFEQQLDEAVMLTDYLFIHQEKQLGNNGLNTIEGRVNFLKLCKPLINKIPVGAYKTLLESELAKKCHLNPDNLDKVLNDHQAQAETHVSYQAANSNINSQILPVESGLFNTLKPRPSLWRRACLLLLHNPSFIKLISVELIQLISTMQENKGARLFYNLYQGFINTSNDALVIRSLPEFLDNLSELDSGSKLKNIIMQLLEMDPMVIDAAAAHEFQEILRKVQDESSDSELDNLKAKIAQHGISSLTTNEKERLQNLLIKG